MRTTATKEQVLKAIQIVNEREGYKIELNRADQSGKWFNFTLRSEKSGIPGSRTSYSGRKLVSASWHAHSYVFDEIFKICPDAVIWSNGEKVGAGFDWQDKNIGSRSNPVYFSETSIF